MTTRSPTRAFSLIELLMVVSIVAVLAAIAAPRYGAGIARYHADSGARRVAADLEHARSTARSESRKIKVVFTVGGSIYRLGALADFLAAAQVQEVDLEPDPYASAFTSARFGGQPEIIFDGYGVPNTSGKVVLKSGSESRTINVDAAGVVTISTSTLAETLTIVETN